MPGKHAMTPVAIIGMAVLLPGAPGLDAYWRNLVNGMDCITDVPAHRWDAQFYDPSADPRRPDRVYCRRGGFVDDFAEFDPLAHGIMPDSVAGAEPDQLIALQVAADAVADAGGRERLPEDDRIGIILGRGGYPTPGLVRLEQRVRTADQLVHTLRQLIPELAADHAEQIRAAFTQALGPHHPEAAIGLVPNLAASRIANRLDFHGPAYTIDAACASALIAVDQAVAELSTGRCDAMLAGGVHHCHDITFWSVFCQLGALSRTGRIRPFDRGADGILIGEGTGVIVLKRLDDALAADDRVYAVIRGCGVASDGRAASLFHPEPAGQITAVRRAWAAAGLDPRAAGALGLLEAHGTATPAGDRAELATIAEVFGPPSPGEEAPAIGSVKSMIGHTMPAAGIAGLVKAALAVHHGMLPPTLHCEDPHPDLSVTRFRPLADARPWPETGGPRRAAVNAFGFGGINAHVVIEQAPDKTPRVRADACQPASPERELRLAANDPGTLAELLAGIDPDRLPEFPQVSGRGTCRIAIVDPTPRKLALARRIVDNGAPWRGRSEIWFTARPLLADDGASRIAFIFPGLEAGFAPRLDDVAHHLGIDMADHATTSIGAHGLGVFEVGRLLERALADMGIRPAAVAGHSVGEWTAMVSGGLFAESGVDEFIQGFDPESVRVPGLVFGAVGASTARVTALLSDHPGITVSHDNGPNQCIVCGPEDSVSELLRVLRARNVLCQVLPFRSGFHTPMLEPYLDPILDAAECFELRMPRVPVWSATIAAPFPNDPAEVRRLFAQHLLETVRFRELIEAMHDSGLRAFVQVGTGALATVIDDVLGERDHLAIAANSPQRPGLAQLRRVVAALWAEGFQAVPARPVTSRPADSGTAKPRGQDGRLATRLDLSGALITLPEHASALTALREDASTRPDWAGLGGLEAQHPIAAQINGLLTETAASVGAVLSARRNRRLRAPLTQPVHTDLRISVDDMPHLLHHSFFPQRDDWPDATDRFPVVPATTVIHHMIDAVAASAPGHHVVAVTNARFNQWAVAAPPMSVTITVNPVAADTTRFRVDFGRYAHATLDLGLEYPPPPAVWPVDPAVERRPSADAAALYEDGWMFHGPDFQGVTEITAISDDNIRGVITTPQAPGALLDNVGQLFGYWIMASHQMRTVVFPVGMRRIEFHGPHPAPGTRATCHIRIRRVDDDEVSADAQVVVDGRVWAQATGWTDRRFSSHADTKAFERKPGSATLARRQPGDWFAVFDRWGDAASQNLRVHGFLNAFERNQYESQPLRGRRQWLLGRIAAKDAVRQTLWDQGRARPVYPAEIRVSNDPAGRPRLDGEHGTPLPRFAVSIAHSAEVAVAIVRTVSDDRTAVGIDVEQIVARAPATHDFALTDEEVSLLRSLVASAPTPGLPARESPEATGNPDGEAMWFTRFWTAKEAVGKALASGLAGNPRRFHVVAATEDETVVEIGPGSAGAGLRYQVHTADLANPSDLPARRYVVAWTEGPLPA